MENTDANPILVIFLFIIRCLVPVLLMLGISYLLKRLGLIAEPPPPPNETSDHENTNIGKGDPAHGN